MKKIIYIFLIITVLLGNCVCAENSRISLFLDNKEISCNPEPLIINGRTMIPARALFEEMGSKVLWEEKERKVEISYKETTIIMTIDSEVAFVNGQEKKLDSPAVIVSDRTFIPLRFVGEAIGAGVAWDGDKRRVEVSSPEKKAPPVIIENVNFSVKNNYDYLTMTSSGKATVKTMILKEPTRLVLDIQNASLAVKNQSFNGNAVKEVRYGDHEDFVRIVAENNTLPRYTICDTDGFTEVKFYKDKKNFDYISMNEHKLIFEEGTTIKFKSKNDKTFSFLASGNISDEGFKIDDELIDKVDISNGEVKIYLKKSAEYSINANVIEFKVKEEIKEESGTKSGLVVLDAGHGGSDPGALGYDEDGESLLANEKDMNLTITLMVYEILTENNVKVMLTRKDDTYVGLLERASFANSKNAELFVSIHNNSIPNPLYKGSMVLYSLDSKIGKRLAANILSEMTKSAGTIDKGFRDGTNMSVIKNTIMPAVIVECGCLTNMEELENLMDIDFLFSLAKGIAEGIMKTLKESR